MTLRTAHLVFWNMPEGEEMNRPMGCIGLIQDILILHMKLARAEEIILERAHRSGQLRHGKSGDASPRPIHVKFFNSMDKEHVLKRAPTSLKNNPYGNSFANCFSLSSISSMYCSICSILFLGNFSFCTTFRFIHIKTHILHEFLAKDS